MDVRLPLNTGGTIPALGLGTWQSQQGDAKKAVAHAIRAGYRHIDTAFAYGNETEVGQAIKEVLDEGIVKRSDLFVTTKLWSTYHSRVEENLDLSLQRLGLDYVDLYLVHWPAALNPNGNNPLFPSLPDGTRDVLSDWKYVDTWKAMEKLPATGKVKAIGVANWSKKYLENLVDNSTILPAVNQIENHPLLPQNEIVDYCKAKRIHVTAYSPLGSTGSPMFSINEVADVAKKHGVGPATVLISWHVARGSSVIPKSVTPSRIDENRKIIELDSADMESLNGVIKSHPMKRYIFPPFKSSLGFPDKE